MNAESFQYLNTTIPCVHPSCLLSKSRRITLSVAASQLYTLAMKNYIDRLLRSPVAKIPTTLWEAKDICPALEISSLWFSEWKSEIKIEKYALMNPCRNISVSRMQGWVLGKGLKWVGHLGSGGLENWIRLERDSLSMKISGIENMISEQLGKE